MAKKIFKVSLTTINQAVQGETKAIFESVSDKSGYGPDGKPTSQLETMVVEAAVKGAGDIKLVFPYIRGASDKLNSEYEFGDLFEIPALGTVEDVSIGIYDGALNIKVYMALV